MRIGVCPVCDVEFEIPEFQPNRKYCDEHKKVNARPKLYPDVENLRHCQYEKCNKKIPGSKPPQTKYCCHAHGKAQWEWKKAVELKIQKEAEAKFENPKASSQKREGEIFDELGADKFSLSRLINGEMTATAYAVQHDWTVAGVTRAVHAHKARIELEKMQGDWNRSWRVNAMLPAYSMTVLKRMGLDGQEGTPEFEALVDEVVRAYGVFSRWYST
ncbi:unnamed protein product, partial [marine sediment metagenome]